MTPAVITIAAVFIGTAALCAGIGLGFGRHQEDPLDRLARLNRIAAAPEDKARILKQELWEESTAELLELWKSVGFSPRAISAWFQQAELPFQARWLPLIALTLGLALVAGARLLHAPQLTYPVFALAGVAIPFGYAYWRRKKRLALFSQQLPDALELMASSLRSGNTVQSSMHVISEELLPPISREFGIVSEAVRLGIPVEQALDDLANRVANEDLHFFVTAVSMQRQCGGDLAELLDKISWLVQERFHIQGQVQALTGEGRMSGAVLMALPVLLLFVVYTLNPEYVMLLFTEPMGKKMLIGAVVLQLIGALVIRRIVNIKI